MNIFNSKSLGVIAALGCAATVAAQAQPTERAPGSAAEKSTAKPKPTAKLPAVEPEAIAALEKMGAFLRDQKTFEIKTKSETEHVLDSGQKIRLTATGELQVRRPDHLRADVTSDRKQRQFFYDGSTFTMFAPKVGFYATVPAPSTIGELATELEERYGLQLPLVDLFYWGTDQGDTKQITAATYIGPSTIDGTETEQYAFRQPGLDWQIWIERGAKPVPRKLVLTTTDDPAKPEHEIEMTWDLTAKPADSVFAFAPPEDARKIAISELTPQRSAEGTKKPARRPPR